MSDKHEDKLWLIKDNNKISGPFSASEVKKELEKGYITPFATACVPGQIFWGFVAAYPEFVNHTDVTCLTEMTKALESGMTITDIYAFQTQTQKTENTSGPSPESEAEDVSYEVIEEHPELASLEKQKKNISSSLLISFSVILIAVAVFFLFFRKGSDLDNTDNKSVSSHFGRVYFSAGNYSQAMQIWKEDMRKNNLSAEDKVLFQSLKFQLNDDMSQSEAMIHLYKDKNTDSEVKKMIEALMQLKAGNLQSAHRALTALTYNNQLQEIKQAAFANLALLSARTGDCNFFNRYEESQFGNQNLIHFAFSLCLLQSKSVSVDQQEQVKYFLQEMTQKPQNYYQEALVGLAYIKYQKGEDISFLIKSLLDSNPYLTNSYHYNLLIDKKIYSWLQFFPLCEKIYSAKKDNKLFVAFYAYCLVRSHHYELAQEFIKKAVLIDSTDVLIKAIHAYITNLINLEDESVLILGDAIQSNFDRQYMLPYILQAQFCEKNKDWECAVQNWRLVLKNTPHSLSGLGGLAYAKYNQGHYAEAQEYVDRGFAIDHTRLYSPLLFVAEMLEKNNSMPDEVQ